MCSSCAMKRLMEKRLTFMSHLTCPQCHFRYRSDIIVGRDRALQAEDEIVTEVLCLLKVNPIHINSIHILQHCLQILQSTTDTTIPFLSVQQIKRQITIQSLLKDSTLIDPVNYIQFKRDEKLEQYLSICILCKQHIPYTDTVKLQCACTCCQKCTLMYVLSKKDGFNDVFDCPNCSVITNNIIQNPEHMQACVNILIKSAVNYWTHSLITYTNNEVKRDLVNIITMYHKFGYIGIPYNLSDVPKPTLRIILAICEEIRLNYLHYNIHNTVVLQNNWVPVSRKWLDTVLETDQNMPKLSFLGTVSLPKYTAFDTDKKLLQQEQKAAESIALNKINTIINNNNIKSKLTAIDKMIIYSLLQNKNTTDNNWSIWYSNTITTIYPIIVECVLNTCFSKYASVIKRSLVLKLNKLVLLEIARKFNVSRVYSVCIYSVYIVYV